MKVNDKYEGFKVVVLDYVEQTMYNDKIDSWDMIGVKDKFKCPECEYLGRVCDRCKGDI